MKTILTSILLLFAVQHSALAQETTGSERTEKSAIEKLILSSFSEALKEGDISKVLSLFTPDAVVMPNNAPTMKGSQQIKGLFENVFKKMSLDVQYVVDEVIINGEYGYIRTHSTGNNIIRASGETMPVNNKELFVVHRDNGEWKITHYIGNHN